MHGMYKFKIPIKYNVLLISGNISVPEVPNIATSTVLNYIGINFEEYLEISESHQPSLHVFLIVIDTENIRS
jgi:hypothetical protein